MKTRMFVYLIVALALVVAGDAEIWAILWLSLEVSAAATAIGLPRPRGCWSSTTRRPGASSGRN